MASLPPTQTMSNCALAMWRFSKLSLVYRFCPVRNVGDPPLGDQHADLPAFSDASASSLRRNGSAELPLPQIGAS